MIVRDVRAHYPIKLADLNALINSPLNIGKTMAEWDRATTAAFRLMATPVQTLSNETLQRLAALDKAGDKED